MPRQRQEAATTNLATIDHRLDTGAATCCAIIETPKGSRSKYTYDPDIGVFELSGLLPTGMSFPLDFGFIPATLAQDGDPLAWLRNAIMTVGLVPGRIILK